MERTDSTDVFDRHRGLLVAVAYRILGRFTDAEDVVQEAWPRWAGVDRSDVADPEAFLVRVVTRLAIDRLRQVRAQRESYVGPWLPEPVATGVDPTAVVERAESVSMAMLVVLEALSPLERAVFVLREAFDYPYAEIADIVERSEAAVRQLARRARDHVRDRAPRFDPDPKAVARVTERFLTAARSGDVTELMRVLAPDVAIISDTGGQARAPRRPIEGADKVARLLAAVVTDPTYAAVEYTVRSVNGQPAIIASLDGDPLTVAVIEVRADRVARVYLIANPHKFAGVAPVTPR